MARADKEDNGEIARQLQAVLTLGAPPGETEGFDEDKLRAAAEFIARAATVRSSGIPIVAIDRRALPAGGTSRALRVAIVNDDMPFLVDSVANCLAGKGMVIQRLLHPLVGTERDGTGRLLRILPPDNPGARRESIIYMEVDQVTARQREGLDAELHDTLAHVRAAVSDWSRMRDALSGDAERLGEEEGAALLRWFLDNHLTQIGHLTCRRDGDAFTVGMQRERTQPRPRERRSWRPHTRLVSPEGIAGRGVGNDHHQAIDGLSVEQLWSSPRPRRKEPTFVRDLPAFTGSWKRSYVDLRST